MRLNRLASLFVLVLGIVTMSNGGIGGGAQAQSADASQDLENTLYLDLEAGRVVIKLRPDLAPKHVERIKELTREGFYDGLTFHRVIEGGSGQKLPAEFSNENHVRGTVSMARSSNPNSADSQFFIVFADAPHLDGQYTIWGQVVSGMEYVDGLKKGAPWANGRVADPDHIVKMQVAADAQ